MKLIILIVIYLFVESLGLFVLYRPLRKALDPSKTHAARAVLPLAALGVLFAFPLIGAVVPDGPVCWFFQKWGNTLIGYMLYFFGMMLLFRLGEGAVRLVRRLRKEEKGELSVRSCRVLLLAVLAAAVVINAAGAHAARDVKTTRYELPKETLGLEQPLRIVLIGDTHVGVNSTPQLYRDMVERINEQEPDLVVVAGDIVTSSYGAMRDPDLYASIFRQIRSRYGTYAVYGNHDVDEPLLGGFTYVGREGAHRHPEMESFIRRCGWTLLQDEVVRIDELGGLCVAGRLDESRPGDGIEERLPLETLLNGTDPEEPILLLQHEPSDLSLLAGCGVDLAVSGHTHDGQIFPGNVITRIKGPQSYGLKNWDGADVIVTSGVGYYGPPIRVGTISEIVVIDLK
ncbi:MAG: metallophosphoesterase [Clostridia bacterium]|nr:metallophosphoesterase [Clostridia bacterium]